MLENLERAPVAGAVERAPAARATERAAVAGAMQRTAVAGATDRAAVTGATEHATVASAMVQEARAQATISSGDVTAADVTAAGVAGAAGASGATATTTPAAATAARLGVMVGGQRMLVSLAEAGEIVPVPGSIMPIPLSRPWVLGLMNLRGALYVVSDLGRFLGGAAADIGRESRLLALGPELEFNATIVVDRMLGLRAIGAMQEAPSGGDGGVVGGGVVGVSGAVGGGVDGGSVVGGGVGAANAGAARAPERAWLGRRFVDDDGHVWRELLLNELVRDPEFLLIGR